MDDLIQALTYVKEMLCERKDEIIIIADENCFSSIGLPVYFDNFYDGNLAEMAKK